MVVASPGLAGAAISWSAVTPPLPSNAVAGGGLTISATSCPTDGWCIAVGNYPAEHGKTYFTAGLIVAEFGSNWTASAAPLPPNASGTDPQAFVQSVACPWVGSCIAVGRYLDSSGATQGLIEQLANGYWIPSEAPLPPDANTSGPTAYAQFDLCGLSLPWLVHLAGDLQLDRNWGAGDHRYRPDGNLDHRRRAPAYGRIGVAASLSFVSRGGVVRGIRYVPRDGKLPRID